MATTSHSNTLPIGRIFRFCLGAFFVYEVWPVYRDVTLEDSLIRIGWALGLVIFYFALHSFILRFTPKFSRVTGAILAFGPFLAIFFLGYGGPAATGALTFLAASLLIAAFRADSGCEVMSIPGVISGKHTHLACLLFSPIDWLERGFQKGNNEN
jgi:hypothetical protein